jgi:hypothetical protein
LLTGGYADNIDHLRISPLETIGTAKFRASRIQNERPNWLARNIADFLAGVR